MAKPPLPIEELGRLYGPTLKYAPPGGWTQSASHSDDRIVKTHCCFCGQQCGIQLRVRQNEVVGFEPWEEFPFNRGMLCPKGVKRYLQGSHPDRLLDPLIRTAGGFRKASWDEALDTTAQRLRAIQTQHGPDSVAVLGGASLISEKSYLLGKFARVALGTRHIDYNGRLCMVSAGTAYKLALGVDRNPNPWSDIPEAQVVLVAGSNVAECFPITTDYLWRMRDNGGKLIIADPRRTPIARNADLYLPVKPGTDVALFAGILHVVLREGLEDREFIEHHTTGFDEVAEYVKQWDPRRTAEVTGVPPESIEKAARWFGTAERAMALHARGIEHHSHGVENVLSVLNLCLATGNIGRKGAGPNMITGQGNGQGGREHGQKCDQLPGQRHIEDPAAREYIGKVWGVHPDSLPHVGLTAMEIVEAIHRGEIKGLLSICFNPLVSLPDAGYIREALNKLEFFGIIDFFLSETAHHADVVLAGSLQEEEEGVVCSGEGRVIKINKAVDPPGNARGDARIIVDLAHRLGKGEYFPFPSTREIFEELRLASKGGTADYSGITWERLEQQMGLFWPVPSEDHPGTPRLFEGGHFKHPDGKAHFLVAEVKPGGDPLDNDYPLHLTTGRVVSQFLSGTQTRRIGPLVDQYPEPQAELHPELAAKHGISNGDLVTVTSRRSSVTLPALVVRTIRPDTVFIPYHWPGRKSANNLTHRTLDPRSKIPEYKNSACRIAKAETPAGMTSTGHLKVLGGR
ncbi:molybdopterin oxidoreductase family protein [uncultured Paludibaculum sp.]|uniref:molybdopterin oxidoreductase family protein n=1 Tax=uncultured Paludibaculum sp. TaxID=1765020 RepID=UPI002AAC4006|nr:molybdopterin oxidoreductase family protein [uncultured Paludibaculum sp.]